MAKKTKSPTQDVTDDVIDQVKDEIIDAQIVDEAVDVVEEAAEDARPQDPVEIPAEDVPPVADSADDIVAPAQEVPVAPRQIGFAPVALGGVFAAALGYVVGIYSDAGLPFLPKPVSAFEQEARGLITAQSEEIATLAEQLAAAEAAQAEALGTLPATVQAQTEPFGAQLETLAGRVQALEDYTAPEGGLSTGEVIALQDTINELKSNVAAAAAVAAEADSKAEAQAARTRSLSAIADISYAVQAGTPFAEPLAVVQENGLPVPDALVATAVSGVMAQGDLVDGFPDLARAALAKARATGQGVEEGGGVAGFLRTQLGARSVAPREGDDADAILSRAEAAVKAADLDGALGELAQLPEPLRVIFDPWVKSATDRAAALAAADALVKDTQETQ